MVNVLSKVIIRVDTELCVVNYTCTSCLGVFTLAFSTEAFEHLACNCLNLIAGHTAEYIKYQFQGNVPAARFNFIGHISVVGTGFQG